GAAWITTGFGSAGGQGSGLYRFEPADNSVGQYVEVPSGSAAVAAGLGSVWVADRNGGRVIRIDPKTRDTQTIRVDQDPDDLAIGTGATAGVWVSSGLGSSVSRITVKGARTRVTKFDV